MPCPRNKCEHCNCFKLPKKYYFDETTIKLPKNSELKQHEKYLTNTIDLRKGGGYQRFPLKN
jgi:hypothetical protein